MLSSPRHLPCTALILCRQRCWCPGRQFASEWSGRAASEESESAHSKWRRPPKASQVACSEPNHSFVCSRLHISKHSITNLIDNPGGSKHINCRLCVRANRTDSTGVNVKFMQRGKKMRQTKDKWGGIVSCLVTLKVSPNICCSKIQSSRWRSFPSYTLMMK